MVKLYLYFLLTGLDYLHSVCRIVHTGMYTLWPPYASRAEANPIDLKTENIMFTFEEHAVFNEFMNAQLENPMQYKLDSTGRPVYLCHNDFGDLRDTFPAAIPQIVDMGSSARLDRDGVHGVLPIQPDNYRAPEVVLDCGWEMSADIWNLGALVSFSCQSCRHRLNDWFFDTVSSGISSKGPNYSSKSMPRKANTAQPRTSPK